jgi:hypothetical protein
LAVVPTRLAERLRARAVDHHAAADCERIRDAFLAQPANALSSLGFVVAGAGVLWLCRRRGWPVLTSALVAGVIAANGVGGLAFHGPGGRGAHWAHDVALIATFVTIGSCDAALARRRTTAAAVLPAAASIVAAAVVLAVEPAAVRALTAIGAAAVLAGEWALGRSRRDRSRRALVVAAGAAAAALVAHTLGRSGGPWCRPDSWVQPHALWHALTALALGGWAWATLDADATVRRAGHASSVTSSSTGVTTPE